MRKDEESAKRVAERFNTDWITIQVQVNREAYQNFLELCEERDVTEAELPVILTKALGLINRELRLPKGSEHDPFFLKNLREP